MSTVEKNLKSSYRNKKPKSALRSSAAFLRKRPHFFQELSYNCYSVIVLPVISLQRGHVFYFVSARRTFSCVAVSFCDFSLLRPQKFTKQLLLHSTPKIVLHTQNQTCLHIDQHCLHIDQYCPHIDQTCPHINERSTARRTQKLPALSGRQHCYFLFTYDCQTAITLFRLIRNHYLMFLYRGP